MVKKVRKRDGRIKDFDVARIFVAVEKVFNEVGEMDITGQSSVVSKIVNRLAKYKSTIIDVESIQDIVVEVLKEYNPEISERYEEYRNNRTLVREESSRLIRSIEGLLDFSNQSVMKENSNKQSELISTTRDLMAGEVSKFIARKTIPKEIVELHDKGIIHVHDMDYYANDMYNCCLVNLQDMLDNGTVINKKKINSPHTLRTAMTITTQICAQVASFQYGLM